MKYPASSMPGIGYMSRYISSTHLPRSEETDSKAYVMDSEEASLFPWDTGNYNYPPICVRNSGTCSYKGSDLSCSQIYECVNVCGDNNDWVNKCIARGTSDAQAQRLNYMNCIQNCPYNGDDEAYSDCVLDNCYNEYSTCFLGGGSSGNTELDCSDISTCIDNCNNDSSCIQTCYDNATTDGLSQYSELQLCFANNNDSCQNEADPSDCLLALCQTEYNTCYGGGSSSGGTCEYNETDISCLQIINECLPSCNYDYEPCIQKGTTEAQTAFWNYVICQQNCIPDPWDETAFNTCLEANCMDTAQACIDN